LTTAPPHCQQAWCYVSKDKCTLKPTAKPLAGYDLFFSYQTCDAVDMFTPELVLSSLRGRTLKLGFVAFYWPWLFIDDNGQVAGFTVDWWRILAKEGGFDIKYLECSNASNAAENHSYDVCGRDVALNKVDSCGSGQAETGKRLLKTSFSPSYFTALYYMVVPVEPDDSPLKMIVKVFEPFSPLLWAVICVCCFVVGTCMWLLGEAGPVVFSPLGLLNGIAAGFRVALLEFLGQTNKANPLTSGGKLVKFGFGFMCLIGVSSYTANLGSFLLMNNLKPALSGIDDAIKQKIKVCTRGMLVTALVSKYPGVEPLVVVIDSEAERIRYMNEGKCGAGLFDEEMLRLMATGTSIFEPVGPQCDKTKVGDPVVTVQYGVPLAPDIHQAVSYLWVREKNKGNVQKVIANYPLPESECPSLSGLKDSVAALRPSDFTGAIAITCICGILGMAVHFAPKLRRRKPQHALHDVDAKPGGGCGREVAEAAPEKPDENRGRTEALQVQWKALAQTRSEVSTAAEELAKAEAEFISNMSKAWENQQGSPQFSCEL